MELTEDVIVDISEAREKFFGCAGKMLVPCAATVAALIDEVPRHRLITTDLLRQELAQRHAVQVTCPAATNKALQAIARDPASTTPYWRVLKKNGDLIGWFVGGPSDQVTQLTQEGFTVDTTGRALRVPTFKSDLVRFTASGSR